MRLYNWEFFDETNKTCKHFVQSMPKKEKEKESSRIMLGTSKTWMHVFFLLSNSCIHFFFNIHILHIPCVIPAFFASSKQNPSCTFVQSVHETFHVPSSSFFKLAVMVLQVLQCWLHIAVSCLLINWTVLQMHAVCWYLFTAFYFYNYFLCRKHYS